MKKLLKILAGIFLALIAVIAGVLIYYNTQWPIEFPDTPYPEITASTDSTVIAEGRYLFNSIAHCGACHSNPDDYYFASGKEIYNVKPSGGFEWVMGPLGTIRSANITPDTEFGVGRFTDGEIARTIRYGIRPNHQMAPFMFAVGPMSDQDIKAIVSYMRTLEPVAKESIGTEFTLLGKVLLQTVMRGFILPKEFDMPEYVPRGEISIARGRYIANGPGMCFGCHSELDLTPKLKLKGAAFSGNPVPEADYYNPSMELVFPNLTPDTETGHIANWSEEDFVIRFRNNRVYKGSGMPWESFQNMTEEDVRSIYRYLMSLDPVNKFTGPTYRPAGWKQDGK